MKFSEYLKLNESMNIIQADVDYVFNEIKKRKGINNLNRVDKNILKHIGQEITFSFPSETSTLRPTENEIKKAIQNLKNNKNWVITKNQLQIALDYYNYN
jgi:hypothetical protein